jgi:SAM-dependent methyltransferase
MKPQVNPFVADINEYFKENGAWEKNKGKQQTKLFAYYFDQVITFTYQNFTLLDVGCALGQAAAFFSRRYPNATVSATDISDVAIRRARKHYGELADFFTADINNISGFYDVIYCSNVLEHFHDFEEKTRKLTACCQRLCIMVPYNERMSGGHKLTPDSTSIEHQYSFYEDSFDFLLKEGRANTVHSKIISCPGAWGWNQRQKITHGIDNFLRKIIGKPHDYELLQIIYDIKTTK